MQGNCIVKTICKTKSNKLFFAVSLAYWLDQRSQVYEARQRRVETICHKYNVSTTSSNDTMEDLINFSVHNDSATGMLFRFYDDTHRVLQVVKWNFFCFQTTDTHTWCMSWHVLSFEKLISWWCEIYFQFLTPCKSYIFTFETHGKKLIVFHAVWEHS